MVFKHFFILVNVAFLIKFGFCVNKTISKNLPLLKSSHDFLEKDVRDFYHNFMGTVKCRDGAVIGENAKVFLKDFGVKRDLRDRFDLQLLKINKTGAPNFVPQSVTFNIWAFSWSSCTDKLYYLFNDVCFEGHRIQSKAFADGHGLYIL